jgi:hypothetical protein
MRIEATLSSDEVADLLRQFIPLEIELGKPGEGDRVIAVDELTEVVFVPDTGVRLQCAARVRWPVLGIAVPVQIHRIGMLLMPSIRQDEGQESLVIQLRIEDADIAWLPALVDHSIVERVNRDLAERHVELAWNFTRTLTHVFELPVALKTAASLGLAVASGRVELTDSAFRLSVSMTAAVGRRPA